MNDLTQRIDNAQLILIKFLQTEGIYPSKFKLSDKQFYHVFGVWILNLSCFMTRHSKYAISEKILIDLNKRFVDFDTSFLFNYWYCHRVIRALPYNNYNSFNRLLFDPNFSSVGIQDFHETKGYLSERPNILLSSKLEDIIYRINYIYTGDVLDEISCHKKLDELRIINAYVPIVLNPFIFREYRESLRQVSLADNNNSGRAYYYGDNINENIASLDSCRYIHQHGLQEQLIEYQPNIFYLNRSLFRFKSYNQFLIDKKSHQLGFFPFSIVLRSMRNLLLDFAYKPRKKFVVYTATTFPNQNPSNSEYIDELYWRDIKSICTRLSNYAEVVIRPTTNCINYKESELKDITSSPNITLNLERLKDDNLMTIFVFTSFTTGILEHAFSLKPFLFFKPSYRPNSFLNPIGERFLKETNIHKVTYYNVDELIMNSIKKIKRPFLSISDLLIKLKIIRHVFFKK